MLMRMVFIVCIAFASISLFYRFQINMILLRELRYLLAIRTHAHYLLLFISKSEILNVPIRLFDSGAWTRTYFPNVSLKHDERDCCYSNDRAINAIARRRRRDE